MIELRKGPVTAVVDTELGGRLASLVIDGCERLVARRTPQDDPLSWGSYPMAPWAGRVRNGRFRHGGKLHQLPLRLPPHALHGTVLDTTWTVEATTANTVQLRADLGPTWPWSGSVTQRFELEADHRGGALRCWLRIEADTDTFPAQVGWHPWFADGDRPPRLTVLAQAMYHRDRHGIPDGRMVVPGPHPWDDCFVGIAQAPRLEYSDGVVIELASDCDHWVIYEPGHAICVEPQSGPPDGFNLQPHYVAPDAPLSRTMVLVWASVPTV